MAPVATIQSGQNSWPAAPRQIKQVKAPTLPASEALKCRQCTAALERSSYGRDLDFGDGHIMPDDKATKTSGDIPVSDNVGVSQLRDDSWELLNPTFLCGRQCLLAAS